MTSTENGTRHAPSRDMDYSVLEKFSATSFVREKLPSSHQSQSNSSIRGSSIQECTQDFSIGPFGCRGNADGANLDKEAMILAPQMVSAISSTAYGLQLMTLEVNWEHHGKKPVYNMALLTAFVQVHVPGYQSALDLG